MGDEACRIASRSGQVVNRRKEVIVYFEGKGIKAYDGDTIASALYAAGVRIFSRSFKYHRPRGLLCFSGKCPNCLMEADGTPNVRTCVEPVRDGMKISHQNAWPGLKFDVFSVIDKLDWLLPVGFYYKTFYRPRWLWKLAEPALRRMAGLGKIDIRAESADGYEHQYRHTEIAVIGGGPAGMSAAIEASRLGAEVVLIDDQPMLGGHLLAQRLIYQGVGEHSGLRGFEIAQRLSETINSMRNVEIISKATAFGCYEGGLIGVAQSKRLIHLRARRIIIATGCHEYPLVFQNNDLPGVFLGSGVQRLVNMYGVKPGGRALVVTNNNFGLRVACDLLEAGIEVAGVVDARNALVQPSDEAAKLNAARVLLLTSHTIKEAKGRDKVGGAVVVKLDEKGEIVVGSEREIACDFICVSMGFQPANGLLHQSGCKLEYDVALGEFVPKDMPSTAYAAGDVTGLHGLPIILLQGKLAGIQAVMSLDRASDQEDRCEGYKRELEEMERNYRQQAQSRPLVSVAHEGGRKKFVCLCEDVTEKDLSDAIVEGFDEIETLKRYSTISMGPCQGRMCSMPSIGICARETGRSIPEIGTTTSRPPIQPVSLEALAGSKEHPVKLTPIHRKHLELGARMMDMGEWKRPYAYTSPQEEYRAVRERVGLIDVSTLGKLDVKGKDAPRLLDKVYTQMISNLRVGRVRYSVICDDSGAILDDGTVSRLAEDHFFITTTTGNIEFVEQWLRWWAAGARMCVHINNITSGLAAVNLAGPKARDVLSKLTEVDLSPTAFPYMACARGKVAGVPALLLRVGFVGETGWEIHFPAEYGEYIWDAVMEAGEDFGIVPFGVEAQRILRLEKKHIIVGQDTDALSNPLEADMPWVVKFEKEDFIGKRSLLSIRQQGMRQKLVGFIMRDSVVAEDGDAVVLNGKPVGRVTSSRFSPWLGKCIGLAWVPVELAAEGAEINIHVNGKTAVASVTSQPFYDPEGKRLRG